MAYTVKRQALADSALLLLEADTLEELAALVANATGKKGWATYVDGSSSTGRPSAWLIKHDDPGAESGRVVILGVQSPYTDAIETICKALGVPTRYVMQRNDASRRITSVKEPGSIAPGVHAITERNFCYGVQTPADLQGCDLTCSFSDGWVALKHVLAWLVHGDEIWPGDWQRRPVPTSTQTQHGSVLNTGDLCVRLDAQLLSIRPPENIAVVLREHCGDQI